ncbi:hypothetical protein HYU19_02785 [Candidatus Woesearchaeota archaeon]|nr:hypothetical protein [Candidatus Woesearchaeota archaeon]
MVQAGIDVVRGEARVEKTDEYWTFYHVPLIGRGDEEGVLRVTRGLLFDGQSLRQDEYVRRLEGAGVVLPTVPEYLSLAAYLGRGRDHPVQGQKKLFGEVKAWLREMFADYWLMTGTRAVYHPDGSGKVVQGVGRDSVLAADVSAFVGPDGWVSMMRNPDETIEALCGIGDTALVNQSFRDVSGKDSYLWRVNRNPSVEQERPVALGIYVRFSIVAVDVVYGRRALGVVMESAKKFS